MNLPQTAGFTYPATVNIGGGISSIMTPLQSDSQRYRAVRWGPEHWGPADLRDDGVYVELYQMRESAFGLVPTREVYRIRDMSVNDSRLRDGFYVPPQWSLHSPLQIQPESRIGSMGRSSVIPPGTNPPSCPPAAPLRSGDNDQSEDSGSAQAPGQ